MTTKMVDAAYRALRRRYAELEALRLTVGERLVTEDELREWHSVNTQMTEAELAYPDGSYRPIAAVADGEDYALELRLAVIKRDKSQCQNCFNPISEVTAHVHHTSYVGFQRLGYSFAFECVTLCRECHEAFHGGLDQH